MTLMDIQVDLRWGGLRKSLKRHEGCRDGEDNGVMHGQRYAGSSPGTMGCLIAASGSNVIVVWSAGGLAWRGSAFI